MEQRERNPSERNPQPQPGQPDGSNLQDEAARLRAEADDLVNAAQDHISRVLSGDSEAFLRANRQAGGQ